MKKEIKLEAIVKELQSIWIIWLRWEIDDYKKWEDLDLYVPWDKIQELKNILNWHNFSLILENWSKIFYKYHYKDEIVILDILKNFDYIFDLFPNTYLKKSYINEYLKDVKSNAKNFACIRYLHMLRSDKKSLNLFRDNYQEFSENNFYIENINNSIFKKTPSKEWVIKLLKKSPLQLLTTLKLKYLVTLPYGYYRKYKVHFNNWQVVCLSGVDWIWKTTICEILQRMTKWRYIYLWYWDTKSIFWNYFNKIQSKNTWVLILKYSIRYIENLFLLPIILFYKIGWRLVILDRHPLLETAQLPKWAFSKLSTFLYKYFFYTPKNIFILHADPEIIYKRKPEKDVWAIKLYQEKQREYILNTNIDVMYIENQDINETCSTIFKNIK